MRLVGVYVLPKKAQLAATEHINELLSTGRLANAIAARYPLSEISAAHEAVESGKAIGNVVVDIR